MPEKRKKKSKYTRAQDAFKKSFIDILKHGKKTADGSIETAENGKTKMSVIMTLAKMENRKKGLKDGKFAEKWNRKR